MILIIALLAFLSVFLIASGLARGTTDPVAVRLQTIRARSRNRDAVLERPFIDRAVSPSVTAMARVAVKLMPTSWVQAASQRLVWAGSPMPLASYVLVWLASVIVFALMSAFWANAFGLAPILVAGAGAAGVLVGAAAPQVWLRGRVSQRLYNTRKQLPDCIDLMTTSVEAGLSLDAALVKVAESQSGPLPDQLSLALQDMTLGMSRREALEHMAERLPLPELVSFIQTINQAEVTGAPVGHVLRVQAEQVRIKRRQAAEAQAQRAPLLMIIPLVMFIFPSLFVVLLGPAAMTIIELLQSNEVFQ